MATRMSTRVRYDQIRDDHAESRTVNGHLKRKERANRDLRMLHLIRSCFFFQAEDGIRDDLVTGVQTCALPIFQRLQSAKKQLPGLQTRVCDVSKAASRKSLVEWLASGFPALNILVNNAGIQRAIDFRTGRNLPQVDAELSTNLAGPIHLSASLIPHLRKQKRSA